MSTVPAQGEASPVPTPVLAEILGISADQIRSREDMEYWRKPGRGVEHVVWASGPDSGSQAACVKYGVGLEREALAYTVLLDPVADRVPRLLGHRPLAADARVVAIEWLEGRTPDLWSADDVVPVFRTAGGFAAEWAARIQASSPTGRGLARNPVPVSLEAAWHAFLASIRDKNWYETRFTEYATLALGQEQLLVEVGGEEAVTACLRILTLAPRLAGEICSVRLTLDPGDFADENAFLGSDGSAYLLDFDNLRLAPVVQMLESVGEDWSSQPAPEFVEVALRAFVDAWNSVGSTHLDWRRFRAAHHGIRVWRKCSELQGSLRDVAGSVAQGSGGEYADGGPVEFARECASALPALLENAVATL